jgi:hypothetical protein
MTLHAKSDVTSLQLATCYANDDRLPFHMYLIPLMTIPNFRVSKIWTDSSYGCQLALKINSDFIYAYSRPLTISNRRTVGWWPTYNVTLTNVTLLTN